MGPEGGAPFLEEIAYDWIGRKIEDFGRMKIDDSNINEKPYNIIYFYII